MSPDNIKLLELQSKALETAANAVLITNAKGIILWVNPALVSLTGYTAEEVIGQTPRLFKSGLHDREFYKHLWATVLTGKTWRGNFINRRKNGSLYHDEHTITPVRSGEGVVTHFIAIMNDVTERKRAEAALLEREEQLRIYAEHSPVAIAMLDLEMKYLVVSQRWMNDFLLGDQSIIGRSHYEVFPDIPQRWREIHQRCLAGAVEKCDEDQFVHPDGNIDWLRWEIRPWRQADGAIGGIIIFSEVITARKATEKQLTLLNTCVSKLNDIVVITESEPINEPGPRIVFVNEAFTRITGYTSAEALGRSPRFLQGRKTDRRIMKEVRRALEMHHPIRRQVINYAKNDTEYWMDIDITPIFDAAGTCTHFVAIQRDITKEKKADEQIEEQAALLDKAQDAIIVRDLEGNILFWNKGAESMYGWTREEVVGRNVLEFFHLNPEKFNEINGMTIRHGEWHGELHHVTRDKRHLTIEARCTLIRGHEGNPKSVLAINTDVTEKKKIEAQFMRAQRMESIGTLAGGIAHDLNNILSPIMMSIDILKKTVENPQALKILETIDVSARRGADIVRQVLSFARGLEGERIEVQPKHLLKDLQQIIKDTFPKDIQLRFYIPRDTWTILGDPTQIHQILLNLCVNARDAMPNGGTLQVSVENSVLDEQYATMNIQSKPGHYVQISVTDSGTGIPPELLEKVFEPFFTTKELHKGTGLGLSTVMAIVKSHDGLINVYSEPGKGTTFKVYLPAMEISLETGKKQTQEISLPRGSGETILVVDDEASILTITSQTLEAFGYRVMTASDGAEAVADYAEHKNDIAVVLIDMAMPVMDGPAAIHALMRIHPKIKIIAASGLNVNGGVAKAAGTGVKHFLTKPYSAGTLLKTLRMILDEGETT